MCGGRGPESEGRSARTKDFQIDFDAFDAMLDENTAAVLINTPNNPSGAAWRRTLTRLADRLRAASAKYRHRIFLISDGPYREIMFGGQPIQYAAKFYDDTLTCYSFSKSLSLPGERIRRYVAANPRCGTPVYCAHVRPDQPRNRPQLPGITDPTGRGRMLDETSDLGVYRNQHGVDLRRLKKLGFTVVKPSGTFYIFPKALEEDANAFCKKAMKYDLALVPGDNFMPNYFRMAYCVIPRRSAAALPRTGKICGGRIRMNSRSGRARRSGKQARNIRFDTINGRSAQCRNKTSGAGTPGAALRCQEQQYAAPPRCFTQTEPPRACLNHLDFLHCRVCFGVRGLLCW